MPHLSDYFDGLIDDVEGQASDSLVAQYQNRLASGRLGVASSLFAALRCKHHPTAAHSLRVALGCSSWAAHRQLPQIECDHIEIAALLHDIGKIGVPDDVLLKPLALSPDEVETMNRHRAMGLYILQSCCDEPAIIEMLANAGAWYDGSKSGFDRTGDDIPLGARMLTIVDAFDAMTVDHVYRPAMSRQRALGELYRFSGTQFDPKLVDQFNQLQTRQESDLYTEVGKRWLKQFDDEQSTGPLPFSLQSPTGRSVDSSELFQARLLENLQDGVAFIDRDMKILLWNQAAERITGVSAQSVVHQRWTTKLAVMYDLEGYVVREENCPVAGAVKNGGGEQMRVTIRRADGREAQVLLSVVPVRSGDRVVVGATLVMHDVSSEASLEEQCHRLQEKATRDPLTQAANRAEFDRMLAQFITVHLAQKIPCSLVMTDLDFFKKVNDTYGHQAGDEALQKFAQLLKSSCRPGDLVARYGGEEFAVLCAGCDISAATRRAEAIRKQLSQTSMTMLRGQTITASFGVTSIQPGDTPETMLRRSDRALLQAKEFGRNCVVQLGDGGGESTGGGDSGWLSSWFKRTGPQRALEQQMATPVPLEMAVEKLRGFISDHNARVESIKGDDIVLKLAPGKSTLESGADRLTALAIELNFKEQQIEQRGAVRSHTVARTLVTVSIRPLRSWGRRWRESDVQARQVMASLRSYLMAGAYFDEPEDETDDGIVRRAINRVTGRKSAEIPNGE